MAPANPTRPGRPISAAGAKPMANAMPISAGEAGFEAGRAGGAGTEIRRARLDACPAIMIMPSAKFAGNANGTFAADRAISALYFTRMANTKPTDPGPAPALEPAES